MIRLFFKTAFRNIIKDKNNNLLNIGGLIAGIIAFLYISAHIFNEHNFDSFHKDKDRIYRCCTDIKFPGLNTKMADSNDPLAAAIINELPEAEAATRVLYNKSQVVSTGDKSFIEDFVLYADSNILDIFSFQLITGVKNKILDGPNKVVLTQKAVNKYFGKEPALGKTLKIGTDQNEYTISGILENTPKNSHLQFDIMCSFSSMAQSNRGNWGDWSGIYTYLKVKPNVNIDEFKAKYASFPRKYYDDLLKSTMNINLAQLEGRGDHLISFLQPLSEIHLETSFDNDLQEKGSSRLLLILKIIGILILLIACINFTNLNTAKATNRAREIGIKKISGGHRTGLMAQILLESLIQCVFALLIALSIFIIAIPLLNSFTGLNIEVSDLLNPSIILTIIALPFMLSFFAGIYPALLISKLKPVDIIKTKSLSGNAGKLTRGVLVSFQFFIFITLIISAVIIRKQVIFIKNQDTGFQKENVLTINNTNQLGSKKSTFKKDITSLPNVITASYNSMFDGGGNPYGYTDSPENFMMSRVDADANFTKTLDIKMIDGEFFTPWHISNNKGVVINEAASKILGWEDCNEKYIKDYSRGGNYKVIGIINNFQRGFFKIKTEAVVILPNDDQGELSVKISGNNIAETLKQLEEKWKTYDATTPFTYNFLNERMNMVYEKEEQLGKILSASTVFAIILACIGLFGLVSFAANKKQKEIGIRKVIGAEVPEILGLLNKEIVIWIIMAMLLSCPIAWLAMKKWLENYAVQTPQSWWIYLLAGISALLLALLTVSWHSWRAAIKNPVEALRYE